jgi:hypothetical protein
MFYNMCIVFLALFVNMEGTKYMFVNFFEGVVCQKCVKFGWKALPS